MKIVKSSGTLDKVTFDMTPMIDCCFQLIIFFMLTLKIFTPEGDFNIKMPLAAPSEGQPEDQLPPIKVRLRATPSGTLQGIEMGNRALGTKYAALRAQIRDLVGDSAGPGDASGAEVELDCDYDLKYQYVIEAITSVSGYVKDGTIHKLVDKIKFSPPRKPQ
ncbi:MAG: biopolymer transporter ExbD [Thermoguttaceae bacterium]|jgi:biopolymer transport protein ExbD